MAATASLMVIGGSGFFGKSILDAFRRGLLAPWGVGRIIVVARHADTLARTHPALLSAEVSLVNADAGIVAELPPADYVIHAASSADAARYAQFPKEERANILRTTDHYCEIARRTHRTSHILYTSSGAVYGQQPATLAMLDEGFDGTQIEGLVAYKRDYAEAKRLAEQRIAALGDEGLRVSIARCFAFVGTYLPRDRHFAIGNFLEDGLRGRPIRVLADRPVHRSYMHADDLVRWLMTILFAADESCPIYNVGSEESHLIGDVARAVGQRFGVDVDADVPLSGSVDRYIPSTAKARHALGLGLEHDLNSALDTVIATLRAGGA